MPVANVGRYDGKESVFTIVRPVQYFLLFSVKKRLPRHIFVGFNGHGMLFCICWQDVIFSYRLTVFEVLFYNCCNNPPPRLTEGGSSVLANNMRFSEYLS